jgi:DNA repair protein RecO (recombination protein O)
MIIKTRGIVFRVVKYGETSIIADIYTEERGLQSYILNSVRAKKPKFHAGLVQIMSLVDMVVYAREGKEIHHVKELRSAFPFQRIPFDIIKSSVGTFMLELAQKTIKENEANLELFHFLFHTFVLLDETKENVANMHLSFMVKLCDFLGILPEGGAQEQNRYFDLKEGLFLDKSPLHQSYMNPIQTQWLQLFLNTPFEENHTIVMKGEERRQFVQQMMKYYEFHIPNFTELKTFAVLQMVLG